MSSAQPHPFGPEPPDPGHPRRDRLIAGALLVGLVLAWFADVAPLTELRLRVGDVIADLRMAATQRPAVAVVEIDDDSLSAVGQWPWPRNVLAHIVDQLAAGGASVVVLDMLLAEADRLSTTRSSATGRQPDGADAARIEDHDAMLATAMRRLPVVSAIALSTTPTLIDGDPVGRFAARGTVPFDRLPSAPGLVRPLPALREASQGFGVVNLYPDMDSMVRTVPGVVSVGGTLLPGLALDAVRVAAGASNLILDASSALGPDGISVADRLVATDARGRIWVDARTPGRIPVFSARRLLAGGVDPSEIAGRIVVVGVSAAGLAGTVRTADGIGVPGALFQAMAIDAIVHGRVTARPGSMAAVELAVAVSIGLALIVSLPWLGLPMLGVVGGGLAVGLGGAAALVMVTTGLLVDPSFPLVVGLVLAGHAAIVRVHEQSVVRRRQAAMLARQDAYMRQVVDASFDAIVTVDPDARIVTANAGAERLFALADDALLGRRIDTLLAGPWPELVSAGTGAALHDAVASRRTITVTASRDDGGAVPTELTVAETAGPDRFFVIVLRDIGARLEAEEAARQAGERLHDAIERITDGFALFGPDRRLVICNARFAAMLGEAGGAATAGADFSAVMRRYAETSCAPVNAVGRADAWLTERLTAFERAVEPRVQECLDGRWFRIDERSTADGGLVGVYTDITELKWREMEMTDAMLRAEAASSAKSEFLANMSHELRTPLNAVIGFADLMKQELFGPLGSNQYQSYVQDIIDSGSKLLSMIEVILEFSRSEQVGLLDADARSSLNAVAETVLRDLRPAALEKEISMTADLDEQVPPVAVDEAMLYQILQNLASNAIKFSNPGGSVSVRTFVDSEGRPGMAVRDDGIGIPADLLDKVTQPFWQRQGPLVRSHGGVGLGLAIVKSHVDMLGGELRFESKVGEGTTVAVILPASRVAALP